MPVYKFKTLEEAELSLICYKPDDEYFKRVRNFYKIAKKLNPPKNFKKGIQKRIIDPTQNKKNPWQ